ncbi:MAG TPA: tetratricopeptide repeat protein [Blastocatellia bacterium]|nr:tetratricopeptide repeat protein [Blastocatellia bacterium]
MSHVDIGVPTTRCSLSLNRGLISIPFLVLLAVVGKAGLPWRMMQQPTGTTGVSEVQSDTRRLEPGPPVERELGGGGTHLYELTLASGQYLRLVVDQRGIDVVVAVFDPGGKQLIEVDSPNGSRGPEAVVLVAKEEGTYRLEVRSLDKAAVAGRYAVWIEELRAARSEDTSRINGERALSEAERLRRERTASSRKKSIEKYQEALPLIRASGSRDREAFTLLGLAAAYSSLGERQTALDHLIQALTIMKELGDRGGEATVLNNMGAIYNLIGEKQKALDHLNQALTIVRERGDRGGEAATLNNMGGIYNTTGEKQKALDCYSQALAIVRSLGRRAEEGITLNNIGLVHDSTGEKRKALEYYFQALEIKREVGDRGGQGITLNNIGGVYSSLGERHKALEYYGQALPLRREAGDRPGEAATLSNIGVVYNSLAAKQKALEYFNQALTILRQVGDRGGEATTLNSIGATYDSLGEMEKALGYFNQALPLRRAVGDRAGEATTLINIGAVFDSKGEKPKALEYYNQSLVLKRAVGDRAGEANALSNIGVVYRTSGKNQEALDYLNQALNLRRASGNRVGEALALTNIGKVHDSMGERQKALEYHNQALAIIKPVGDPAGEALILFNMARTERGLDDLLQSRTHTVAAIDIIETIRSNVAGPEFRSSYLASVQQYFEFYIDLLMHLHKMHPTEGYDRAAFQAAERARARSLLEALIEAHSDIRKGVDPSLLARERSLQSLLDGKIERRVRVLGSKHTPEQAAEVTKEVESLVSDYQELQSQIRATSPQYAALTQPQPLSLSEIQQQVLDPDTLLLEYSLGNEHSYMWAVSQNSLASFELPGRAEIDTAARRVHGLLAVHGESYKTMSEKRAALARADAGYQEAAASLSHILLGPLAGQLSRKRLLVVADGVLQYVPFAALPVPPVPIGGGPGTKDRDRNGTSGFRAPGSRPLIVDHEIISLPSASVLALLRRETAGRKPARMRVAVIADPVFHEFDPRLGSATSAGQRIAADVSPGPGVARASTVPGDLQRSADEMGLASGQQMFPRLPFTRLEAKHILANSPAGAAMAALDFDASKATATGANLSDYRIVHFATHALVNDQHPELSGLVLSLVNERGEPQDGFLRLNDIYNLNLSADLVVLSACQTALGKEIKREGIVGLTRGFMYAGAPRVLASVWKVDDAATAHLMKLFYSRVLRARLTPAAALRSAELTMWKQGTWKSPFYWAGFVIYGEWK